MSGTAFIRLLILTEPAINGQPNSSGR